MNKGRSIVIAAALLIIGSIIASGQSAPQLINYQGRLTGPTGQPLADGTTVDLTFAFYGAETGGTAYLTVIQEDVAVQGGIYNVLIGSGPVTPGAGPDGCSTPAEVFRRHGDVWMGVSVDGDPEMSPRSRITSVPYSLMVDSFALGEFVAAADWDGDGFSKTGPPTDCNDGAAGVYPGAPEVCDGVDNQCPGDVGYGPLDEGCPGVCTDWDVDGYYFESWCGSTVDCDDFSNPSHPGGTETCDGLDNDCDGSDDEDWPLLGQVCIVGQGECMDSGNYVCTIDETGIECDAVPLPPQPEACNGLDDNCDGSSDEDWPMLGLGCTVGQGECMNSGNYVCTLDETGIECDAVPFSPQPEMCNGLDDNCDGSSDEDWPELGEVCIVGQGECMNFGTYVCTIDEIGIECDAVPFSPQPELCNGLDDNCDGSYDEDWPLLGQVCTVGQGECMNSGTYVCTIDETGIECDATPLPPQSETCNGLDDNCDGSTDEDWPLLGQVCAVGQGECMNFGNYVCTLDETGIECSATPFPPQSELCNGLDDNCDGDIDEDWPILGNECTVGIGECMNGGFIVCTVDGTGTECDADPYSPLPETGALCSDTLDNDCDGDTDCDDLNCAGVPPCP